MYKLRGYSYNIPVLILEIFHFHLIPNANVDNLEVNYSEVSRSRHDDSLRQSIVLILADAKILLVL